MSAIWILPILGALVGCFELVVTIATATSSAQRAAGASLACAEAIVPYVLARAATAFSTANERKRHTELLQELVDAVHVHGEHTDLISRQTAHRTSAG